MLENNPLKRKPNSMLLADRPKPQMLDDIYYG